MAWHIEGRYFENCSCEVVCPCTASLALGADNDYCRVALVFHVDSGEVDDIVPFGSESGEPSKLTDIFHPAGSTLTVSKATDASGLSAFGIDLPNAGKSGFSTNFSWAA